jgi:threonine/homoserine/homoserine lactone efflux protein
VALQLLGAAYLVWLGGQTVVRALRGRSASPALRCAGDASARSALRQGALSNLANPKMAVFFIALLPQFAPSGPLAYPALLALGLCFGLLTFAWLGVVSTGVARTSRLLVRDRVRRLVEAVTGAMLVGLGVRLATHRA